jgi:hypothetical protein
MAGVKRRKEKKRKAVCYEVTQFQRHLSQQRSLFKTLVLVTEMLDSCVVSGII